MSFKIVGCLFNCYLWSVHQPQASSETNKTYNIWLEVAIKFYVESQDVEDYDEDQLGLRPCHRMIQSCSCFVKRLVYESIKKTKNGIKKEKKRKNGGKLYDRNINIFRVRFQNRNLGIH